MDSTYEGLKRGASDRSASPDTGLDSTYEGLKRGVGLGLAEGTRTSLDSTYEGLKPKNLASIRRARVAFGQYL